MAFTLLAVPVQAQFNPYKYVVVPIKFEDFKQVNQHQTSTMVKHFLTQRGIPAIYDSEKPEEIKKEPCKAAYVRLNDDSGLLRTRLSLTFLDCQGKIVFETGEGSSKEKVFTDAYKEALQEAFATVSGGDYVYTPVREAAGGERPPAASERDVSATNPQPAARTATEPVPADSGGVKADGSQARMQGEQPELTEPSSPVAEPVGDISEMADPVQDAAPSGPVAVTPERWYAQEIENGFQLVDSTPKIRMRLLRTSREDTYIALVEGNPKGMVFREGDQWIHEYYENGDPVRRKLDIKF